MAEVFKPRSNMVKSLDIWECVDKNGLYVCDGGPSVIWDDGKGWNFYETEIGNHRIDGPASSSGRWYIKGINVTEVIHAFAKENDIVLNNLTDEDKVLIALTFG